MEDISKPQEGAPAADPLHFQEQHEDSLLLVHAHPFHDDDDGDVIDGSDTSSTNIGAMIAARVHDMDMGMDVGDGDGAAAGAATSTGSTTSTLHQPQQHALAHEDFVESEHHNSNNSESASKRQRLDEQPGELALELAATETAAETTNIAGDSDIINDQNRKIHNEQWNEMLERLKAYKAKHGHCLVPKRFSEDGKLGTWVETQRVQYKRLPRVFDENLRCEVPQPNKRLTAERLEKLHQLGFSWSAKLGRKMTTTIMIDDDDNLSAASNTPTTGNEVVVLPDSVSFEPNPSPFATALPAPATTGVLVASSSIPREMAVPPPLSATITAPTTTIPAKRPAPDSQNQAFQPNTSISTRNLSGPGVHMDTTIISNTQWEDFYTRLVKFKEWHGHVLVPRKYEADPKLAAWVESLRVLWNRDQNKEKTPNNTTSTAASMNTAVASLPSADDIILAASTNSTMTSNSKRLTLERKQRLDDLGFVWSLRSKRIEDHWDEMYQQLVNYKNEHGDCLVPSRFEENLKLGKWVETQRYEWTKLQRTATSDTDEPPVAAPPDNSSGSKPIANPRLTQERLRRLEAIGFEWKVKNKMKRYYDKQWDSMFQRLLDFKQAHGHCNVPKRYPDNMKLGTWTHTQRIQYRKLVSGNTKDSGGKDKNDPSSGSSSNNKLSPYGDAANDPAFQYTEENASEIAGWTVEQAQSYRLTDARRKRLEEVGFCWSARESMEKLALETAGRIARNSYDDQWDAMFDLLAKYKAETGDCLVPKRHHANPKLGTWVDTQRVQYKKMLKKIADLQHQKQTGEPEDDNASVGSAGKEPSSGKPLVGRLTQERIQRLQQLGFVWSLRDDWVKHYEELKAYKEMYGHCNVPARFSENRRLGIWVSAQRQQYKILQQQKLILGSQLHTASIPSEGDTTGDATSKAKRSAPLTQERIDLLNSLGFVWTIRSRDSFGESWNQRLVDLRQFKQEHGHCLVPSRYDANPELGIWVGSQRTQYRIYMRSKETGVPVSTNMNEDRLRELEELGFVWALRGTVPDDVAAAADAAATAVELADQVAVGAAAAVSVGQDPSTDYHTTSQHHHHNVELLMPTMQ